MAVMWPSSVERETLQTIMDLVGFAGVQPATWNALSECLGTVPNIRMLAMIPPVYLTAALAQARLPVPAASGEESTASGTRELSAVDAVGVVYMWRVARHILGLPDADPFAPPPVVVPPPQQTTPTTAAEQPPTKKVKVSTVLDQGDETEVRQLGSAKIRELFENHIRLTGAEPLPEAEPSPEQMSALLEKVVSRDEEPYADFSVLTPSEGGFRRRFAYARGCCRKMGPTRLSTSRGRPRSKLGRRVGRFTALCCSCCSTRPTDRGRHQWG